MTGQWDLDEQSRRDFVTRAAARAAHHRLVDLGAVEQPAEPAPPTRGAAQGR